MEELPHANALNLEAAIQGIMDRWGLEGKNMVGLGTDGASVMTGQHHSLQSLLRRTLPHVIHNSCTNHALYLAAKNAVKAALPSSVDYILRSSFNWFSHSASRVDDYRKIAQLIGIGYEEDEDQNDEAEQETDPKIVEGQQSVSEAPIRAEMMPEASTVAESKILKLISPCATRWLIISDCIDRLLPQYDALSAHFQVAGANEHCYEAKTLAQMYKDEAHRLFMIFLNPQLKEIKRISTLFQSNQADNVKIYSELKVYFMSLGRQILKPMIINNTSAEQLCDIIVSDINLLPVDLVDLGQTFPKELNMSNINSDRKLQLKENATNFLRELFIGLQKRIKPSLVMLRKTQAFKTTSIPEGENGLEQLCGPILSSGSI